MIYFKFEELNRSKNPVCLLVHYINFAGGITHKYKIPTWSGHFYLPLRDDFYKPNIRDGGGWVEVEYEDGTTEKLQPIGTYDAVTKKLQDELDELEEQLKQKRANNG